MISDVFSSTSQTSYPNLGGASDWLKQISFAGNETKKKHKPELGVDTSSVRNFFVPSSDIISQRHVWWRREISAAFSG